VGRVGLEPTTGGL